MKVIISLFLVLFSCAVSAQQCDVTIERDVKSNNGWLLFHLDDGRNVEINDNNQVLIGGEVVELSPEQLQAVQQYRHSVTEHFKRLAIYAQSNAQFLDDVIDDIASSLGAPDAFDELKGDLDRFWQKITDAYLLQEDLILPAGTFDSLSATWHDHATNAKVLFDEGFIDQAWQVLSEKIKQEGGVSLTEMGEMLVTLENSITERLQIHSHDIDRQESQMCDSLHGIVDQENELRSHIPELKDYRVFTI
jgi:hypothetical protein